MNRLSFVATWLGRPCRVWPVWLARGQTHRRSLSGTHRPASFKPGLGGPPKTFAHDASAREPVVHAVTAQEERVA